ncbi:PKD domain containing protein [Candidatus Omnitrophus magneticus]|uniref:PKD domain containing protein n=1 Tax=Candidatus Omnitrophus magneticus TaxID=1609969 RepID=A0A0F0CKL1_9BACT|nr:PKD domain containing protein [Candidatus Omnitrophus magneticus]
MSGLFLNSALATEIPYDNSNVKYFYVFGKDGDPLMGAEDSTMEIFVDVPEASMGDVTIGVYDPNIGGKHDWRKPNNEWDTACWCAVCGGTNLLDKKEFGVEAEYDGKIYNFGPYPKTKGEKIGNNYRFKLLVKGESGDDENLFKVFITPNDAEAFSNKITIRLLSTQGEKMYFYPEISGGTKNVIVDNYDLDVNGGTSTLSTSLISEHYPVKDSESGQWCETVIPLNIDTTGRLVYIITKGTQRYANAGVRFKDDKGNIAPIYFRPGKPVVSTKPVPAPRKPEVKEIPDIKCNKFTFDATNSYDVDKQKLSYLWNFGDGQTSTDPVVTHVYEKGGDYTVTLTVTDSSGLPCNAGVTSQKVSVNTPPVADFSGENAVCENTEVVFDASATMDNTPDKLTYAWDFGDGSQGEGKSVKHTYAKGGKYPVVLKVDDNAVSACSVDSIQKNILVNSSPISDAGEDKTLCINALEGSYDVSFDGSKSKDKDGDKLTYTWHMGDGTTEDGMKFTHTYKTSGVYTVTLTVDDGTGLACSKAVDTIKVSLNRAPLAIAGEDKKVCTGESISFDGSASKTEAGEALSYEWTFGDGEKATGEKVVHVYNKGGKYTAVLVVDDNKGTSCSKSTDTVMVDVNSAPIASIGDMKNSCVNEKINFDASGSSDPDGDKLSYMWNFGDGVEQKGSDKITHAYSKGGLYNATVTVSDGKDSSCSTSIATTKVKVNTPPMAKFDVVRACCAGMEQKFNATESSDPDGDRLTYLWDFGDGTTAEGAQVTHVYSTPGKYKVVLKVDDGSGITGCSISVASTEMEVNASPVAIIKII